MEIYKLLPPEGVMYKNGKRQRRVKMQIMLIRNLPILRISASIYRILFEQATVRFFSRSLHCSV